MYVIVLSNTVHKKKARLIFGVEKKRERATFDGRTNKVRVHSVVATQNRIVLMEAEPSW